MEHFCRVCVGWGGEGWLSVMPLAQVQPSQCWPLVAWATQPQAGASQPRL